jgi:AbrB family looped-hinge helix DNA binding protein
MSSNAVARRMNRNGQVTLPKKVRDQLGMEPGDYLLLELGKDAIEIRKGELVPTTD